MTENMLVSLDDAALDDVNGGLSLGLQVNEKTLLGASLDLNPEGGIGGSITLFGRTISVNLGLNVSIG